MGRRREGKVRHGSSGFGAGISLYYSCSGKEGPSCEEGEEWKGASEASMGRFVIYIGGRSCRPSLLVLPHLSLLKSG